MRLTRQNLLEKLRESVTESIYPISMGGEVDIDKLERLVSIAEEATRIFKNEEYISKKLLIEIFSTADVLRNDNEFLKREELNTISTRLMLCYNLLIASKSIDESESGELRII